MPHRAKVLWFDVVERCNEDAQLKVLCYAAEHYIRINDTYRIRFTWAGKDADNVEIGDFHL